MAFMRTPEEEMEEIRAVNLLRQMRCVGTPQSDRIEIHGRPLRNFSSNDYLGLASCDLLKEYLKQGVEEFGAGAGASRLVCGSLGPHFRLERALADFKRTEAALTFSTGYAAAVGTMTALLQKGDVVILDKLSHASLIDGARLSGAQIRVFPHNRMDKLADLLRWAIKRVATSGRILVVTESVFSMDGDWADLTEIIRLKDEAGALLLLDEAHAFGILGTQGRGLADKLGLATRVDIYLGTLSKAAGLSGGFICSSQAIIDLLTNRARSFIYSTAPPPAIASAAADVVTRIISTSIGDRRRAAMWGAARAFCDAMELPAPDSAIIPIVIGGEQEAMERSERLLELGYFVPAIRFPTVARGSARLRITFSANHSEEDARSLARAFRS